jgi:hypothetical protein
MRVMPLGSRLRGNDKILGWAEFTKPNIAVFS